MSEPPKPVAHPSQADARDRVGKAVKARLPRGFSDRSPSELAATQSMVDTIKSVYELYGFEAVETPFIEYTEALGKFLPDLDRPNEGVFSFQDDDEAWLSLRYDLTAPLARFVAEHFDKLAKPYRSYRFGWVFRNEKPGPGRFRQFLQFDADTVGAGTIAADAEICMMAADTLTALGFGPKDYVIKVNNRKVLDGILEGVGLAGSARATQRLTVLRAIDKLDRLGASAVRALLGPGRQDQSGDFTRGAELKPIQIDRILEQLTPADSSVDNERIVEGLRPLFDGSRYQEGLDELAQIGDLVRTAGYADRVRIDSSVVRGLEYYTGPVFEAELTFEVKGDDDKPIRFGSIGGGGRYDGLVARFRAEPVPATGISIGISRLLSALTAIGSPLISTMRKPGPVVVLVLDRGEIARYQSLAARLRQAGIAAELYLGGSGMNAQLKYADRRGSVCAVIQGSNEREAEGGPRVMIRDLIRGAQLATMTKDRGDYLELRQQAQFTVSEDRFVDAVRSVLTQHQA
jgi:histidyl-tRNA synthetase